MEHLNIWIRTGTKDLKRSQEYPLSFGRRVAECHLGYMTSASRLTQRKNVHFPEQSSESIPVHFDNNSGGGSRFIFMSIMGRLPSALFIVSYPSFKLIGWQFSGVQW